GFSTSGRQPAGPGCGDSTSGRGGRVRGKNPHAGHGSLQIRNRSLPECDYRARVIAIQPGNSSMTLPSESVSDNWLYFVVVVAVGKWEAAFCFPLSHSLFLSIAQLQPAIAAVLRFQSCSNCVGLT